MSWSSRCVWKTASVKPCEDTTMSTAASLHVGGETLGRFGLLASQATLDPFGLQGRVVVAELALPALLEAYPPAHETRALPKFPGIERDLSVVVEEGVPWQKVQDAVRSAGTALMESLDFVGVYRGKQVGAGRKSVTLRMRFCDPQRTLRHEEVDPQVAAVTAKLRDAVGAELRG